MYYEQFFHAYFGWLGGPRDADITPTFSSLTEAEAHLHACPPGVKRRVVNGAGKVVLEMNRNGRVNRTV